MNRVQERIAERLKKLGFEVQFMPNPLGENRSGKLLLATRIPKSAKDPRFVTLVMHADTVFEPESGFTRWNPKDAGVVQRPRRHRRQGRSGDRFDWPRKISRRESRDTALVSRRFVTVRRDRFDRLH